MLSSSTGACGQWCSNAGGDIVDGSKFSGEDTSYGWAKKQYQNYAYYIARDGTITKVKITGFSNVYYLEKMDTPGVYNFLTQLQTNNSGLVRFPDSKDFFNRYGPEDKEGENNGVKHGKGDHYLNPDVAAALFGLAAVLKDSHGITMSFGDMSAENGTDPYTKGGKDHLGHGHDGRSGLDIDFRYVDKDGNSFQGRMDSATFDKKKNQTIYDTAKTFGFIENYQGKLNKLTGVETEDGHNNHGHLGFNTSSATIEYSKKHLQTK